MAKKDFSGIITDRVYNTIAQATAETEPQEQAPAEPEKKPRKEYTEEEANFYRLKGKTAGRKGAALPRINMACYPDVYDYIQVMSRVTGDTISNFINTIIRSHMENHRELYDTAKEFKKQL